ncbi:gp006 [Rhodococcus phage ReqiDocB7]|uniref:gp006 n=1 Tax=Rhodococcus phage ReqiDocB7 TaxID=691966 RepID=UPI0001CDEA8F|nr:gp006 [Rhodococcus phage ReqiDocB7]ADD80792.1 gp006 [Rhodococcus phage ReqiDocB7]
MPYLYSGNKPKKMYIGSNVIKKIVQGTGSAIATLWQNTIPFQMIVKSGTQQLGNGTWEKITGWSINPAYTETEIVNDALVVAGRASFIIEATVTYSGTSSSSKGCRVVGWGNVTIVETSVSNSNTARSVSFVMPDATDTTLELYGMYGSSITSNRVVQAGSTNLSVRVGSYYEQMVTVDYYTSGAQTEAVLEPNAVAEWPRVPGQGIFLKAGTYTLNWQLYSTGWGTDWRVACDVGGTLNEAMVLGTSGNTWNLISQTITVPSDMYVMPKVRSTSSSYKTLGPNQLNLFISKLP